MATKKQKEVSKQELEIFVKMQRSPIYTIYLLWQLKPQPVKDEYKELVNELIENGKQEEVKAEYFKPFVRGKHFTWQQYVILYSVELAVLGKSQKKISIRSGHGIGKSTTMSWLIIWFILCYPNCRIPCTAPTGDQLHDVLWTEIRTWVTRFPDIPWLKDKFDVQRDYIRINEEGNSAFARARTARKETPEALAGLHAENMMMIVDESSGVPDEIFNVARGAFTEENVLVILISNPTRLDGYFYRTHMDANMQDKWQRLAFSTLDSPLSTSDTYAQEIIDEHGENSNEYRIRVLGEFPSEDDLDKNGWARLLNVDEVKNAQRRNPDEDYEQPLVGEQRMGIDPAGEGTDETSWVVRDKFQAKIVSRERISNTKGIAQKTLTLFTKYPQVNPKRTYIDNFGIGAEISKNIALAGIDTNGINVGDKAQNSELYRNLKAEMYMRLRRWIQSGGKLSEDKEWEELTHVRFRRGLNGKIEIMSKRDMRKEGYKSPNNADALAMTFIEADDDDIMRKKKNRAKTVKPNYQKASYNRNYILQRA